MPEDLTCEGAVKCFDAQFSKKVPAATTKSKNIEPSEDHPKPP